MRMFLILLLLTFLLLISCNVYAFEYTDNYRFYIPGWDEEDWQDKISNDLISIDSILNMVSTDTNTLLTDSETFVSSDVNGNIGIKVDTPTVTMDVSGTVSVDAIRFDYGNSTSFDTGDTSGPGLYVSLDPGGTFGHLIFYDGAAFYRVSMDVNNDLMR